MPLQHLLCAEVNNAILKNSLFDLDLNLEWLPDHLKTRSNENCGFSVFNLFLWNLCDDGDQVIGKLSL